jgi:ssDNA-binding Zn-finger/Zn-ribbon topoisomerase 1
MNDWQPITTPLEKIIPEAIKDVTCPQCKKDFKLKWNSSYDEVATLVIRSCPSGGIYDVSISCPHCNYEEEL